MLQMVSECTPEQIEIKHFPWWWGGGWHAPGPPLLEHAFGILLCALGTLFYGFVMSEIYFLVFVFSPV